MFKRDRLLRINDDLWTIILNRSKNKVDQININSTDIENMHLSNNFLQGH